MDRAFAACTVICLLGGLLGACAAPAAPTELPTATPTPSPHPPTATFTLTPTPTDTPLPTTTDTPLPSATPQPTVTSTPLPSGYGLAPVVEGLHYLAARETLIDAGFTFIYRDVYDRDHPFGTILEQDPPPGTPIKLGKAVILYRGFQAPGMWVGEACMPLRLTSTSGKLLFAVYLHEDEPYCIRTDFGQGRTSISDFRMIVLKSIDNKSSDEITFEPPWEAWYVITIGPYKTTKGELEKHPKGVPAGCLWVYPPEE
jgi:hypothetical protein